LEDDQIFYHKLSKEETKVDQATKRKVDNIMINVQRPPQIDVSKHAIKEKANYDLDDRVECENCGRKFNTDRIDKH